MFHLHHNIYRISHGLGTNMIFIQCVFYIYLYFSIQKTLDKLNKHHISIMITSISIASKHFLISIHGHTLLACIIFPSFLEDNRAFNKSCPIILFWHFGCVSTWLKPEILCFPFNCSFPGVFWSTSYCPFLRTWFYSFWLHVQTISTFFAWWQCLSFPFRLFVLPSVVIMSLKFSSDF